MASTSYINLLETSLFEPPASNDMASGRLDFSSLVFGSKTLHASHQNGWKWQNGDAEVDAGTVSVATLVHECYTDQPRLARI
jgi:hypothetical protein